jgi:DNA-binding CsgD family transcriptional regulator
LTQAQMDTVLTLVGLIYDAVADASRWPAFLEAFVRAIGGRKATLSLRDSKHPEFAMVTWFGWSDEDVQVYIERYAAADPWGVASGRWPEGVAGTDREICPREEMEPTVAFREYYAPRDAIHGIGGTILVTDTGQSIIAAVRGAKDGPFGELEKALILPLLPHLRRAALLHGELGSLRSQLSAFTSHLDRYPHSLLLIDVERRLLYANAAAREIMESKDGFVMEAGQVSLTSRKQDAAFREAVGKMASDSDASLLRLEVPRPSRQQPYRLMLMPVQASGVVPLAVSLPAVSVLIIDSDSQPEPDLAVLRELFSLTPAEARVAGRLVLGRNVEEIAADAGISIETVRTHIKRILSKTATERQGELISLMLRSVPFRRPPNPEHSRHV